LPCALRAYRRASIGWLSQESLAYRTPRD
jgi:hypothetical protein